MVLLLDDFHGLLHSIVRAEFVPMWTKFTNKWFLRAIFSCWWKIIHDTICYHKMALVALCSKLDQPNVKMWTIQFCSFNCSNLMFSLVCSLHSSFFILLCHCFLRYLVHNFIQPHSSLCSVQCIFEANERTKQLSSKITLTMWHRCAQFNLLWL